MAGLLDFLNPQDPAKQQGLLAAAAALLQAGGPSRMPISTGQGLGAALGAYQQGTQSYQDRQQQQSLYDLKLRGLQGELDDQDQARTQRRGIDQAARDSVLTPGMQALAGGGGPTNDNAARIADSKGGFDTESFIGKVMAIDPIRGLELRKSLAKAGPKFDSGITWVNGPDGKPVAVRTADDGSFKQLDGLSPREKLHFLSTGGATIGVNEYTGDRGASYTNTATPGDLLSAATQRRGQDITMRGQNLTDARAREQNAITAAKEKAPTEFQGKSAAFGLRATEADKILRDLAETSNSGYGLVNNSRPGAIKGAVESVPLIGGGLGAALNILPEWAGAPNSKQQRAEQAQRDFVNAVLRQESGAAIGESEFDNARRQYFAQLGDGDAVIAQKARNRALAIQGLQANAGRAALKAPAASGGWSITKVE